MKSILTFCLGLLTVFVFAQSPGDTIVVETFNYTQTHGVPWDGTIRDTMIDFPNDPEVSYEKIIMLYNMRCKDGLVSNSTNRDRGCGEWDYSCNTYIHDSSRVDSVLSYTASHYISAFSGDIFEYVETPLYDYYQYRQKDVQIDETNTEDLYSIGDDDLGLLYPLTTSRKSGKTQYLYLASELTGAGVSAGDIDALILDIDNADATKANYLKIKLKQTSKTEFSVTTPDLEGFTEVYFRDYQFAEGSNRIQFYTPFTWDGTSNIIVEFSFTNHESGGTTIVAGSDEGFNCGIHTFVGYSLESVNGKIELPVEPMSTVTDAITISFWSYGNEKVQPIHNSIFLARDSENNKTVNMHLPWGNSSIYWDCGNTGGSYDRIDKAATPNEIEGQWNHWAVTKDTTSGEMKIYLNGEVWHSGTDKKRTIDIQEFILGSSGTYDRTYFGKIDEFRVWDKELSQQTIKDYMHTNVDDSHPDFENLVAYYKLNEGSGNTVEDFSGFDEMADIDGYMYWVYSRGDQLNRDFEVSQLRPKLWFAQGDYDLTISDQIVTDSVMIIPNIVREYEIIPRYGTMLDDSISELSVNEYWQSQYQHIYDPEGTLIDSIEVTPTNEIELGELDYFKRYPMWFDIMSFVTPYGIYLDLGMEGKTWVVDVTDYMPILKGNKRMTVERGGQWQEDMDIKFLFIVGTPPRDVLDFNQLWRADSKGYTAIINDRAFEPRDIPMHPDGEQFKIRSTITGHGQQGEFSPRYHFLKINGNEEFNWRNWTECSTNPIYPQGGTWIYDRAGWCPGQASDLYEYDITDFVTPGESTNIDYGLEYANGTSNYIVNNQLVTYGGPNFMLDASVLQVLKPNSMDAKNDRFNPACDFPEIVIQNTGETTLTSLDIEYSEEGGESISIPWTGSLEFMEVDTVVLPIYDQTFWLTTSNVFVATVSNPNGQQDEYEHNNTFRTHFEGVDIYPEGEILKIVCKTNNYGWQTNFALYDGEGDVYLEWDNLDDNTIYDTPLILPAGCYKLQINDKADDGLTWWHNSTQGSGYLRLRDEADNTLYNFETEFGRFAIYEFGIGEITSVSDNRINSGSVAVYPNPAYEKLFIQLSGFNDELISLKLMNSMSAVVLSKDITLHGNAANEEMFIGNLSSGIYFLEIKSKAGSTVKKIIKK